MSALQPGFRHPTPLNIRTSDPSPNNHAVNLWGLDVGLPAGDHGVQKGRNQGLPTSNCKTTTDPGQALIDGNFDHAGRSKDRFFAARPDATK
jgi:hypothetical protein